MKGRVFNIQRFSIHDGPGIRTSVFLKGCNLGCLWCHNPESNSPRQEIQFFEQKCTLCLKCIEVCPESVFFIDEWGKKVFDRSKCTLCGECVENCMYDALVFVAKYMRPEEVVQIVMKDADYYKNSGGGLTISGGEPLLQKEFVKAVFERTRALGVHNALDTAANVRWEDIAYVLPDVDLVLLDLKVMDPKVHKQGTQVSNARILDNARKLSEQDVDIMVRIPVVPGINDSDGNMHQTAAFLKGFSRLKAVQLLPYHDMGVDKLTSLGKDSQVALFDSPTDERIDELRDIFVAHQIPVA